MKRKAVSILWLAVIILLWGSVTDAASQTPVPTIKVNDMRDSVQFAQPITFKLSLSLNSNGSTENADWWFAAATPVGFYFLTPAGWTPFVAPAYQGPLFNFPQATLLDFPILGLPASTFEFYFGVDTQLDGALTWDKLFFDSVQVSFAGSPVPVQSAAKVAVPVLMYYLDRYFANVPDPTDFDKAIGALLDNSPNQEFFLSLLNGYKAIPKEMKDLVFDQQALLLTKDVTAHLSLASVRQRIASYEPELIKGKPEDPTGLNAQNISLGPDPDTGVAKFQIKLTWVDNSTDEDGFVIYRAKPDGTTNKLTVELSQKVGANATTFVDSLPVPISTDDQYCYQVTSFREAAFHKRIESEPSNIACSYYHWAKVPLPPDADKDGFSDAYDKCPYETGISLFGAEGCPDLDKDGVADKDDSCPLNWGEDSNGCPIKYNIRWMGMKLLNNSGTVAYGGVAYDDKMQVLYNESSDAWSAKGLYGEEPYLLFAGLNGMDPGGAKSVWVRKWCCGENVIANTTDDFEPDNDISGEETFNTTYLLQDFLDHGMTVFPEWDKQFSEISKELGFFMTVTLIERDWDQEVTLDNLKVEDIFKVTGAAVGSIASCVGTGGLGCITGLGGLFPGLIDAILGWLNPSPTVTIKDPDDYMGSVTWFVDRLDASAKTSTNGAYGFFFDVPHQITCGCSYQPCYMEDCKPWTMRSRVYFCLYREGIPEKDIKNLCGPLGSYEDQNPYVK